MSVLKLSVSGSYTKATAYLRNLKKRARMQILDKYGKEGVALLKSATPVRTGLTAESWIYEIKDTKQGSEIIFRNTNVNQGWAVIAILLQYGHGTKNGGWVEGIDYINPAIQTLFKKIVDEAVKEVTSL